MADFDKPGMRVAAVKNAAPLMILERTLKNARVVAADSENAEAAKAFITFLTASAAAAVIKAKGMNPG